MRHPVVKIVIERVIHDVEIGFRVVVFSVVSVVHERAALTSQKVRENVTESNSTYHIYIGANLRR